jgi:hypothetical protein
MSGQSFYKLGVITYFQLNRKFIAEVLCINKKEPIAMCHGQCFLKKKLDLADPESSAPAPVGKEKVEFPTFIVSEISFGFRTPPPAGANNTDYLITFSSVHLPAPFHPPTVV